MTPSSEDRAVALSERQCSIDDCSKPIVNIRGWCSAHYQRWRAHGDPLKGRTADGEPKRYLHEVVLAYEGDECMPWPYGRYASGYGRIRGSIVSRLVCEAVNGPPPTPKHEAAHSCGKGHEGCVTKGHLSWKTHAENMADTIAHGTMPARQNGRWVSGASQPVHQEGL